MSADQTTKTFVLKGVGVSPGIAIGRCYRFDPLGSQISFYKLKDESLVPKEVQRFKKALKDSEEQLLDIQKNLRKAKITEPIYVIDVHILILKDKVFSNRTVKYIREQGINAEWALRMTLDHYKQIFEGVQDDYISSRVSDVQYVVQRILRNLSGEKQEIVWDVGNSGVIVVSHDISPADTAQMKLDKILGFATDSGGRTSHTAIVARSLELPAVVGLDDITHFVRTDDEVIVDGTAGMVVINPYPDMLKRYEEKKRHYDAANDEYLKFGKLPAVTLDNYQVQIGCNIEFVEEIPSAIMHGAESIGLYRTEFLYIYRENLPTEDDHFNNYRQVVTNQNLSSATIRTFDLGGDKFANYQKQSKELNPQMGVRAIRFCLKEVDIFKTQLRAIWRASVLGKTKIMFPMISSVEEIREAKKLLEEARQELIDEGMQIPPKIEIGAMIEVPSAVVIADKLAQEVDFFSIGTNDLIQYSLAIDRANERLTYMYEPLHPAVLRLIQSVVDAAHKAKIEVAMCGEMAGDPLCILILLGMELDELSMNHLAIPRIKKIIRECTLEESKTMLKKAMSFNTASEVRSYVQDYMLKRFPEEFQAEED
ncbi:MAG: phosphoenolpyruvate--protein phosphotransferase [Smithella sp.]|nr:phosphoenolpyruvate--protein phosphotransferase [Smithella sp.]MDM7987111.1 phosphoenolpyruvate--protein phosphotransferase [Smithella sp.]HOU51037.1 phosphoenolpyruvate--protein phosphotransferase [Smithella sp.]HQG65364.1 phosphoenolpyruvate--protein phosphotransferase [Smithella sp.]HQI73290.1 phosphoenolpyruvate--protein phosphotransferase [Smithella sp.]